MPTGLAFKDGALYVIAVDKLIRYDNAEANLDKLGDGKVVYDDMPSYAAHGWKYIAVDKDGWFFLPFGHSVGSTLHWRRHANPDIRRSLVPKDLGRFHLIGNFIDHH